MGPGTARACGEQGCLMSSCTSGLQLGERPSRRGTSGPLTLYVAFASTRPGEVLGVSGRPRPSALLLTWVPATGWLHSYPKVMPRMRETPCSPSSAPAGQAGRRAARGHVTVLGREPPPPEPAGRAGQGGGRGGAQLSRLRWRGTHASVCGKPPTPRVSRGPPCMLGSTGDPDLEPEGEDGRKHHEGHPLKRLEVYDVRPPPLETRRNGEGERASGASGLTLDPPQAPIPGDALGPGRWGLCPVSPVPRSHPTSRPQRALPARSSERPRPAWRTRKLRCGAGKGRRCQGH